MKSLQNVAPYLLLSSVGHLGIQKDNISSSYGESIGRVSNQDINSMGHDWGRNFYMVYSSVDELLLVEKFNV